MRISFRLPSMLYLITLVQIQSDVRGFFPEDSFFIGFSSIFWLEACKYGDRAFRYCNHDVGHAAAAVSMVAAGLGCDARILDGLGCEELKKLMGLTNFAHFSIPSRPIGEKMPAIEFEHSDCILLVFPSGRGEFEVDYEKLSIALSKFANLEWKGKPNALVHEILGLKGSKYQSLYHFTIGCHVLDKRIMSLPAYPGPDIEA